MSARSIGKSHDFLRGVSGMGSIRTYGFGCVHRALATPRAAGTDEGVTGARADIEREVARTGGGHRSCAPAP
jgi:hypothetical protein